MSDKQPLRGIPVGLPDIVISTVNDVGEFPRSPAPLTAFSNIDANINPTSASKIGTKWRSSQSKIRRDTETQPQIIEANSGFQFNQTNESNDVIIKKGNPTPKMTFQLWKACLANVRKLMFALLCIGNKDAAVDDAHYSGNLSVVLGANPGQARVKSSKLHVTIKLPDHKPQRVPSVSDFDWTLDTMPEMYGVSPTLSNIQVSDLFLKLPSRLRLMPWTCLFRTDQDGYSLARLYSRLKPFTCPVILIIEDQASEVFGALLSSPNIKMSGKKYFGNAAETFLFAFNSILKIFPPTGSNDYFIQGMPDGLSIGGGRPAIWIDDDLDQGCSLESETFDNYPLCCPPEFRVSQLECWGLDETYKFEALGLNVSASYSNSLTLNSWGVEAMGGRGSRCSTRNSRSTLGSMCQTFDDSRLHSSPTSSSCSCPPTDSISRAFPGWRSPCAF